MPITEPYTPQHPVRIVSAAAIFDGHDAAINVMRRILQATGAEVIHLGHNRSAAEVVDAAIQEDAQGIALSSYQGGHVEYFRYMRELLDERGAKHVRIYGGGGGVIVEREIAELHAAGIDRIFSPEDGRELGLQGMINMVLQGCDYDITETDVSKAGDTYLPLARKITLAELRKRVPVGSGGEGGAAVTGRSSEDSIHSAGTETHTPLVPVIGITGAGGAGKSSLTDELARRFVTDFADKRVAIISVDPTKRRSGGALLGDRIRFNSLSNPRVYMRSLATRGSGEELSAGIRDVLEVVKGGGFDLVFVETAGIGQGDSAIVDITDISMYVMTAEYGAASQLEKIEMLDHADFVVINKYSRRGSADALREVRKQYQRNRVLFSTPPDQLPVFGTNAAQFNDSGVNALYAHLVAKINMAFDIGWESGYEAGSLRATPSQQYVIHPDRERYLSEITAACREYRLWAKEQGEIASELDALRRSIRILRGPENRDWHVYGEPAAASAESTDDVSALDNWLSSHFPQELSNPLFGQQIAVLVREIKQGGGIKLNAGGLDFWFTAQEAETLSDSPEQGFKQVLGGSLASFLALGSLLDERRAEATLRSDAMLMRGYVIIDPAPKGQSGYGSADLVSAFNALLLRLDSRSLAILRNWDDWAANYEHERFIYHVRGNEVSVPNYVETLSETQLRKVARPRYRDAGDRLYWRLTENVPGEFPYTAGTFPFKRQAEDPTRMFAGEGPAERTNARFHYLASGQPAVRLSTAFDSITLYGEDPDRRPDIYGKIGESGVSIFTVEEAERLYSGFDLLDPKTSVSMTINGPAPTILAFFMNTALRQQCRKLLREQGRLDITEEQVYQPDALRGAVWADVRALLSDEEYSRLREATLRQVRGTVQADILKEDQAQNTCIFSTEFSLKLMGDVQQYFIDNDVTNFYSVSISGYHIAEAGANPIHQLAYTLSNGFTYVEYYRSRGMDVSDFARNLSFFFSNGMDAEYSVIGRAARRIWAVAMERLYGADARSQMLKYHIQTSGRSLHAQEIEFNDIRTTLQALLAIFDNAQSLHTNAYDEAITTPTEESVRRAMAVQLIINREFGLTGCENAIQGSFIVEELTDLVEEAVLAEFDRISERGGVLGAMERQYQRGQIQDDSIKYERLKHSGDLPLIGVNTFMPVERSLRGVEPEALPAQQSGAAAGEAGRVAHTVPSPDPSGDSREQGKTERSEAELGVRKEVALTRTTYAEKDECLARLVDFHARHAAAAPGALMALQQVALSGGNVFEALMDAVECCSLGQITHALYEVGGEYRRNI